jgi:hypothetical protein
MAAIPPDEDKSALTRFKEPLRRPGYWSIPRVVAAVFVVAVILVVALQLM